MMKTQQHKQADRVLSLLPGEPLHPGEYRRVSLRTDHPLWHWHIYYDAASQTGLPMVQVLAGNEQRNAKLPEVLAYLESEQVLERPTFPETLIESVCEIGNGRYWPITDTQPLLMFDRESGHVVSWHHEGIVSRYELERLIARLDGNNEAL